MSSMKEMVRGGNLLYCRGTEETYQLSVQDDAIATFISPPFFYSCGENGAQLPSESQKSLSSVPPTHRATLGTSGWLLSLLSPPTQPASIRKKRKKRGEG